MEIAEALRGMDKTTCNASTVQEELGLVKAPYATEYMTKYMNLQNSKKYKVYREVQHNIYLDCMASGDVGEVTKWAGAAKDRQKPSWREWQMFVLELTKKQEARPSGQPHAKSVLLTLPNEVLMMIFRFAFYGYAKTPDHEKRRRVELETRWDRGKVEWSYMCQVCPLLRKIATVVFFSETKFEYNTNDSPSRTTGNPLFLRRLNPDYIGLIRYISISFSDGDFIQIRPGRDGRQPFSEIPGHLEILNMFAKHGNLNKAEFFFGHKPTAEKGHEEQPGVHQASQIRQGG